MTRSIRRSLFAASVALGVLTLVVLMWRVGDPDTVLGVDRDTALLWVRACATGPGLVVSPVLCVILPLPAALLGCAALATGLLVHAGHRTLR